MASPRWVCRRWTLYDQMREDFVDLKAILEEVNAKLGNRTGTKNKLEEIDEEEKGELRKAFENIKDQLIKERHATTKQTKNLRNEIDNI